MDTAATPLTTALAALKAYELGSNRGDLLPIEEAVRSSLDDPERRQALEDRLLMALDNASVLGQVYLLKQLALTGSARAVARVAKCLGQPELADPTCRTLAAMPCPEAAAALRDRLPRLRGAARLAAVHALGHRRDTASVSSLAGYLGGDDATLADAAASALGRIGSPEAGHALAEAWPKAPEVRRRILRHAIRDCADRLRRAGEPAAATSLLQLLD